MIKDLIRITFYCWISLIKFIHFSASLTDLVKISVILDAKGIFCNGFTSEFISWAQSFIKLTCLAGIIWLHCFSFNRASFTLAVDSSKDIDSSDTMTFLFTVISWNTYWMLVSLKVKFLTLFYFNLECGAFFIFAWAILAEIFAGITCLELI